MYQVSNLDSTLFLLHPLQCGSMVSMPTNFCTLASLWWFFLKLAERLCSLKPLLILYMYSCRWSLNRLLLMYCFWQGHAKRYITDVVFHVIQESIVWSLPVEMKLPIILFLWPFSLQAILFLHGNKPFRSLNKDTLDRGSTTLGANLSPKLRALLNTILVVLGV